MTDKQYDAHLETLARLLEAANPQSGKEAAEIVRQAKTTAEKERSRPNITK